jgi:hypothetical protein
VSLFFIAGLLNAEARGYDADAISSRLSKKTAPVMEATPGTPEPPGGRGLTLVLILFPLGLES